MMNDPRTRGIYKPLTRKNKIKFRCSVTPSTRSELTIYWFLNGKRFQMGMINCRCVMVKINES